MGSVLSQPVELIRVQRKGNAAFKVAVAEMQGWRTSHEDAHAMGCSQDGRSGQFWILDGHGGDGTANIGAVALPQEFDPRISSGVLPTDEVIRAGFEVVDKELLDRDVSSGSTVIGALAVRKDDGSYSVQVCNCGDSRGLVVRGPEEGALDSVMVESVDHKPDNPEERARIEAAGGFVSGHPVARVDGSLAVSRGLGDFNFKERGRVAAEQKVCCVPDVYRLDALRPGTLLILGCDGLWDVMSAEQAAGLVRGRLQENPSLDLGDLAAELVRTSLESQSGDNVTVMIVHFVDGSSWADEPDEMKDFEKLEHDNALDNEVREKYLAFLRRSKFPMRPQADRSTSRWLLQSEQALVGGVPA